LRGGKRTGAGRKPDPGTIRVISKAITLPPELWAWIDGQGGSRGSVVKGLIEIKIQEENKMFNIIITPNYYGGHINAPQEHLLRDSEMPGYNQNPSYEDRVVNFETREDAQESIDALEEGTYYLSHGEAGAPGYKIIEDGGIGEDCYPGNSGDAEDWDEVEPSEIPAAILKSLKNSNVEYEESYDDFDTYSYSIEDKNTNTEYKMVFCPKTVSIQLNIDDLGGINWEHEAYYKRDL